MNRVLLSCLTLLLSSTFAIGQSEPPVPYGAIPNQAQLNWHEMGMYCIIHFGPNTFTNNEWGYGDVDPKKFNPSAFDAMQIVGAAKAGGFKGVVIVAKHHDGFCLWPTHTTAYNVSQSSWKNGQGDIVKEYKAACDKLGMKLGIYCSPWDRNSALYGTAAYINMYRSQITELYTHYGKLFISWHDGANGGTGYYGGKREERKIDRSNYYQWDSTWAMIRELQPQAAIFGDVGPDVRWVGNEEGHAGETCWATYVPRAPVQGKRPANGFTMDKDGIEGTKNGKFWMPAECDVSLRPGWFYHSSENQKVKSARQLLDLYYESVGRGADLNLGLSPDQRGQLSQGDVESLKTFGALLEKTFAVNLIEGASFHPSNVRANNQQLYGPSLLIDANPYTFWGTDDSVRTPSLVIDLSGLKHFNVLRLKENIKLGQHIRSFSVDIFQAGNWVQVAAATSIGANRLVRFQKAITAQKLRLRITSADACIALSDFGLFNEPGI